MKKKRYFAWILFSVCLVMLVAAVFPHHHHDDLTLCMHYDLQTCCDAECPDSPHHHGGRDCGNACVTSFCCDAPHPSHLISPLFYFIVDLGIRADAYGFPCRNVSSTGIPVSMSNASIHWTCKPSADGVLLPACKLVGRRQAIPVACGLSFATGLQRNRSIFAVVIPGIIIQTFLHALIL